MQYFYISQVLCSVIMAWFFLAAAVLIMFLVHTLSHLEFI